MRFSARRLRCPAQEGADARRFFSFFGRAVCTFQISYYLCTPNRDYSSVGLERLLHTQEVSSSNLLSPTLEYEALTTM